LRTWYEANFGKGWFLSLLPFLRSQAMEDIRLKILDRRKKAIVYPPTEDMFKAFKLCPWEDTRVVIIGQDPYHTPGYANGLAFSSGEANKLPPSLRNILTELENDIFDGFNINIYEKYDLTPWAKQGVLLINTALTVEKGKAGSHSDIWPKFTEAVLTALQDKTGVIYVLWGNHAKSYKSLIREEHNYILEAAHPSPFSAHKGFYGCKHFSKINEIIEAQNGPEFKIDW